MKIYLIIILTISTISAKELSYTLVKFACDYRNVLIKAVNERKSETTIGGYLTSNLKETDKEIALYDIYKIIQIYPELKELKKYDTKKTTCINK